MLVLYEKHPLQCHSTYGVYLVSHPIDYIQIQALSRLLEKVKKVLSLLFMLEINAFYDASHDGMHSF